MADNFFAQFHDQPPAAPAGTANYFSQFHPEIVSDPGRAAPPTDRGTASAPPTVLRVTPKAPDAGMNDAAQRGLMQGVTLNWNDELQAIAKAGGATDDYNGIQHLIAGLARLATGNEEARKVYDAEVTKNREADKAAGENHPYVKGAADVVGTLLTLPAGGELLAGPKAVAEGANAAKTIGQVASEVAGRAGTAAKQGAAYGAVAGAGEGEGLEGKAAQGTAGGVLGGILGGVAQPVIEGAGYLVKKGTEGMRNAVRGVLDTEGEAARRYLAALRHDIESDPKAAQRLTSQEFQDHPDARLVDLGGGAVRALADDANITSPAAAVKFKTDISDNRFGGQNKRFSDWFLSHFSYPDAFSQGQALDKVAKTVNGPNYAKAYREGSKGVWSPALQQLTGAPSLQEALFGAVKPLRDRGIVAGYKLPRENPFVTGSAPHTIQLRPIKDANGKVVATAMPELAYWDQAVKNLGGMIGEAQRAGNNETVNRLTPLKQQLLKELDRIVPSYKAAREGAAGFFGADNALEAGKKFVTDNKISMSEARDALGKMSSEERKLFTDGFISDFVDHVINGAGDRRDILNKIADSPKAREKLGLVMGPDKYRELEAKLRVEGIFRDVKNAVQGNSKTAARLYNLGIAGGAGLSAHGGYETDPKEIASGALIAALASKGKAINVQVATKLMDMMLSRDPAIVQKGFKYLAGNPTWMNALRNADAQIGRLVSQAAPTSIAPQMLGVARADNQPKVERPKN